MITKKGTHAQAFPKKRGELVTDTTQESFQSRGKPQVMTSNFQNNTEKGQPGPRPCHGAQPVSSGECTCSQWAPPGPHSLTCLQWSPLFYTASSLSLSPCGGPSAPPPQGNPAWNPGHQTKKQGESNFPYR